MPRDIGFVKGPQVWEGPLCLKFCLQMAYSPTVRYNSSVEGREFAFYIPYTMLPALNDEPPPMLHVAIMRCKDDSDSVSLFPPEIVSGKPAVFRLYDDKVRSKIYHFHANRQKYDLYVPNEVFGGKRAPEGLIIQTAMPKETPVQESHAQKK